MAKRLKEALKQATDPQEFVFHSTDEKGHSSTVRVNIPNDMAQMMNQIVQKGYFEYRTREDIIRDSLYHRLAWLDTNRGLGLGEKLRRLRSMDYILDDEQERIEFQHRIEKLGQELATIPDEDEQKRLVSGLASQVQSMPEGYWKKRYLAYLKDHYGHLVKPWSMAERTED